MALFGTRGILASILFLFVGFGTGWLLGGPRPGYKGRAGIRLPHSAILPLRSWSAARISAIRRWWSWLLWLPLLDCLFSCRLRACWEPESRTVRIEDAEESE